MRVEALTKRFGGAAAINLWERQGLTLVFIEHDMDIVFGIFEYQTKLNL